MQKKLKVNPPAGGAERKVIEKIGKYCVLLLVKESYLLSRNLYGLVTHPFKTLRVIERERDYSQAVLVFGFPVYFFMGGVFLIVMGRFLVRAPHEWGMLAKNLLLCVLALAGLLLSYLVYWLRRVKRS